LARFHGNRKNNAPVWEHLLYNYSFYATRFARKYGRGRMETGSWQKWRKEAMVKKWRERERERVDNSQDRIVPGAKNRSIPECYRMTETLAGRAPHPPSENALLKIGENCFIRAYTWQYQLARFRHP